MKLVFPRLYAIIDAGLLRTSELAFAETLAEAGVALFQYRNKQASSRQLFEISRGLVALLRPRGVRLVVNDRPDVAAVAGADGVHVGQEDLDVEHARALCGPSRWIGVSTHTLEQVRQANETSADYIAAGPVFPTTTKERPDPVVGLDFLRHARTLTPKPLVAIGGITLERAEEVFRAGADALAVGRDLLVAPDPAARARELLNLSARVFDEIHGRDASDA